MKVSYRGSHIQWNPMQQKKLDAKFAKLGKLLDRRGEKEAHVILTSERRLHKAEITINYYDHPLVGIESAPDEFTALLNSIDKLEKQVLKTRAKWRDNKRAGAPKGAKPVWEAPTETAVPAEPAPSRRVYRVNHSAGRKPMTLEEALLAMDNGQDYLVYRDAETDHVSVLLRRRDGNFDLIES